MTGSPTAQQQVLTRLRDDLVVGRLRPGDQVRQAPLAARYGTSRVPLREALKVLEGEGLMVHLPHRGYFVAALSVPDLVEVYRLRELLEAEAIRLAVTRITADDLVEMARAADAVTHAGHRSDIAALTISNRRFHFVLFEASGSPRLVRLLGQLWDATDVYRSAYFDQRVNRERIEVEHAALLAQLRRRNAPDVIRAQAEHRDNSMLTVRALIETGVL